MSTKPNSNNTKKNQSARYTTAYPFVICKLILSKRLSKLYSLTLNKGDQFNRKLGLTVTCAQYFCGHKVLTTADAKFSMFTNAIVFARVPQALSAILTGLTVTCVYNFYEHRVNITIFGNQ